MKKSCIAVAVLVLVSTLAIAKPVKVDDVRKVAATKIQGEAKRLEKLQAKTASKTSKMSPQSDYTLGDTKEIRGKQGELLAYVTELKPEGFIITSADTDIAPVLGYSFEGAFPFEDSKQNVLLHLVQWDVQTRCKAMKAKRSEMQTLAKTNSDLWRKYVSAESGLTEAPSDATQWGPLITTNWYQGDMAAISHYNRYCPTDPFEELPAPFPPGSPRRCPVGCVATALGQIVNYWEYPHSMRFDDSDVYSYDIWRHLGRTKVDVDGDHLERDFPTLETLDLELSSIAYEGDEDEEAYLCLGLGVKLQMNYQYDGSGSYTWKAGSVLLDDLGYGSARTFWHENNAWTDLVKARAIENVKQGWPVQLGIREHSVVLDGYRSTDEFFHINMGGNGTEEDTWYNLPVIDTRLHGGDYYSGLIHTVVCDITPYQGWNQWGSDEKNSFSTIYAAPTAENGPITHKWYVTSDSEYTFAGLVVGAGNRIYASSVPDTEGYHPSIWVINQYGEVEGTPIAIIEEIGAITNPVQNSSGEIFVGADSGKVYRIDPKDNSYIPIFMAESQLTQPPKIDSDGRIYVCTQYKLYCLSRSGYEYWEFPTPSSDHFFFRKVPAIDVARNKVYIDYYNPYTDIAYLACIDRAVGTEICRKSVTGITSGFLSFSIPSIGDDGIVYAGCYTNLYALNPDGTLSEKWNKNLFPTYVNKPPAIGANGNIYTTHWYDLGGGNYSLRMGARYSSSGNVRWEVPVSSDTYDTVDELYVSGNGVVSFWLSDDTGGSIPDHTIMAYRDNGGSNTSLWQEPFGQNGGKTAFGPGAALYIVSSSMAGNTIQALFDGAVGDPDGGGMAYTNNAAPVMPSSPNPIDEANNVGIAVTLSWICSDPEAHALKYSLFVGESGYDMVPLATDISSTSYELAGLKPGTGYAWKIIATDGQAISESPTWVFSTAPLSTDINGDGGTNFRDFAILSAHWSAGDCDSLNNWCENTDLDGSGAIDGNDISILTEHWLERSYYTLSTSVVSGNGTISPTAGTYAPGDIVNLTANANTNYRTKAWNGTDDDSSRASSNTVTMTSDKVVSVEFEQFYFVSFYGYPSTRYYTLSHPGPAAFRFEIEMPSSEKWTDWYLDGHLEKTSHTFVFFDALYDVTNPIFWNVGTHTIRAEVYDASRNWEETHKWYMQVQ